ncbi:MAG: flippase-like domain-containing protein [Nanoarchaeota archaeon]|nr:flippase-like domain-containing protein [Nanoarchaeota archaeon]MBU1321180.1 flippase-like domain-containing protein [Nanoarchaeota archaeon]MBU1598318.1 flippase-like domain-containing protein [Nanoarchaeota archaeon]MBU2441106.1 flippase-like domain-containing protein [Nanoarchaeota archaeon]
MNLNIDFKSRKLWTVVGSALLGVIILIIILLKYPFKEIFATFKNFTPLMVLLYLVVSVVIMCVLSFRWKVVLNAMGYKVPFYKLMAYRIIGYGLSYITPSAKVGGEPLRAALLKRQGMTFSEGLSSVIVDKTIELSFSAFFFLGGVILLIASYAVPGKLLVTLIVLSAFFLYLVWAFYSRIMKEKPVFAHLFKILRLHKFRFLAKHYDAIVKFEEPIIKFYKTRKKAFFIAVALSFCSLLISLLEYHLVLSMLGIKAPVGIVFMVFSLAGFAFLIPLPMALGTFEAFQVSLFAILGIGPAAAGIGVAMITRSRDLLWVLCASLLSLYIGSFKNIVRRAYGDRPIVGVGIVRRGQRHRLDIKIHRPSEKERK